MTPTRENTTDIIVFSLHFENFPENFVLYTRRQ